MDSYSTIIFGFTGVTSLIIGIILLFKNSTSPINRSLAGFCISQFLWIVSLYMGYYCIDPYIPEKSIFFIRLAYGFGWLMYLFLPIFFYNFPQKTFSIHRITHIAISISATAIFFVTSFSNLVHLHQHVEDGIYVSDDFGPLYMPYTYSLIAIILVALLFVIQKIVTSTGIAKKQILLTSSGFLLVIASLMTNVVLPLFNIFIFQLESITFSLFFLIPTFYAIQKYHSFNIHRRSLNTVRQFIIWALVLIMAIGSHKLLTTNNFFPTINVPIFITIGSIIFYSLLQKIFPEITTPSFRLFRNNLKEFQVKIYECNQYEDLSKLLEEYFHIRLHINYPKILIIRDSKKSQKSFSLPTYPSDIYTEELNKKNSLFVITEEEKYFSQILISQHATICFPLYNNKQLIGLFFLGEKESQTTLNDEEIQEINDIKRDIEIVLMNILISNTLRAENDLMKNIVEAKTKKLKDKNEKIQKLLKQKEDFLAITAHEFRTPLSIALFQLEDTLESHSLNEEVHKEVANVKTSLENLKHLTQRFFDVQQFDLNKIDIQPVPTEIKHFISGLYGEFIPITREKNIIFTLYTEEEIDIFSHIDQSYMREVIYNILNNAVKFTPENHHIDLIVEKKDSKQCIICIGNEGSHIPDKDKKKIFEKFQTRDITIQQGKGIGLGLYICKKVIELHKGKIWVEDYKKNGTAFFIQLTLS